MASLNSSSHHSRGARSRMVENETLQDANGNEGVYNGPVILPEHSNTTVSSAVDMSGIGITMDNDDPDAPPPPLTDVSLEDDTPPIPHGTYGTMCYMNHSEFLKYTGDWDHGVWTKGTLLYTNGNVYTGQWNERGQPHGAGKLEWVVGNSKGGAAAGEDSRTYEGEFVNGAREGQGTYTWSRTGAVYQGAFEANQRHGYGTYQDPSSNIEYVGEWKQGVYAGYGQYTWTMHGEKCVYKGTFARGVPHGMGVQVNEQGVVMHDGKWDNGKPVKAVTEGTPKQPQQQPHKPQTPMQTPPPPFKRTSVTLYNEPTPKATTPTPQQHHQRPNPRAPPGMAPRGTPSRTPAGRVPSRHTVTHVPAPGASNTPQGPPRPQQQQPSPQFTTPPQSASKPMGGGGAVTVVADREWMDTVNQATPTMGIYRGLWLHQNPYQNGVVVYQDGSVNSYEGWFNSQGYFHGQGCRLNFRNGDTYHGDFHLGQRHGTGHYTWKDGRQYKGQFVKNSRQGKGTLIYPNSDFYEGQFASGKRHGVGRFIFSSGSMYEGHWRAGFYHGQGTLVQADGCTYVGQFQKGAKHGQGKDLNPSGEIVYEGLYVRGKPQSKDDDGSNPNAEDESKNDGAPSTPLVSANSGKTAASMAAAFSTPPAATQQQQHQRSGSVESSYWVEESGDEEEEDNVTGNPMASPSANPPFVAPPVEDEPPCHAVVDQEITDCQGNPGRFTGIVLSDTQRPHGVGRLVYADGKRIHEGFWKNGSKEGHGRCLFFPQGDFHEGEYQHNLRNGPGRYQWKDGRLFIGHYKDDMRHGKGVFSYPTGDKYEGNFLRGQRSGYGKFVFQGGQYEGEWSGGKYEGQGRLVWGRGTLYEGGFAGGTFHGIGTLRDYAGNILEQGRWFQGKRVASASPRAPPPAAAPPPPPPPQSETPVGPDQPEPLSKEPESPLPKAQENIVATPDAPKTAEHQQEEPHIISEPTTPEPSNPPPMAPPHDDDDDNGHSTLPSEQGVGENPVETKQQDGNDDDRKSDDRPAPVVNNSEAIEEKDVVPLIHTDEPATDDMPLSAVEL